MDWTLTLKVTGWGLCGLWLVGMGLPLLSLWWRRLPRMAARIVPLEDPPRVSVIIAARNEGPRIGDCLKSLLASDYPDLELIAVNDRSDDETGEVMDQLAASDSRVRVVHLDSLPSDWLGKNHAMAQGASAATGQWLLFTDGDVIYAPETISLAVAFSTERRLDHLTISPSMLSGSYAETALISFFGVVFSTATQSWLTRLPTRHIYVGVGAFNLVLRETYEKIGGHEQIRYDVADDLKLGQLLKQNGARADILLAGDYLKVRWQQSAWSTITGLEKNGFAGLNYSIFRTVWALTTACLLLYSPIVVLLVAPWPASAGFAATLVASHLCYAGGAIVFGASPWVMPVMIPASAGMLFAFARSMVITLRQGGVRWRDTFYPLEDLRAGLYR